MSARGLESIRTAGVAGQTNTAATIAGKCQHCGTSADKCRIAVGYDADLTIVDMKRRETITNAWIESRSGWTPYDGQSVTGWPVGTVVRGRRVMWQGEILGSAPGEPVRFLEAGV